MTDTTSPRPDTTSAAGRPVLAPAQPVPTHGRRRRELPRRELRIVGRTVATYDVDADDRRTAAYMRRVFAQRRIPDDASIQLSAERIVVEWTE